MAALSPTREAFRELAQQGNLVPVYREILADGDTPVSAFARLGGDPHAFLLESVVGGEKWATYSFLGVAPRAVIHVAKNRLTVKWSDVDGAGARVDERAAPDPLVAVRQVLATFRPVDVPGLPRFWGGAVGWVAYDVVRSLERLPEKNADDQSVPDICLVLTDTLVIFDNLRQTVKVVATAHVDDPSQADAAYDAASRRVDALVARLRAPAPALAVLDPPSSQALTASLPPSAFGAGGFQAAVGKAKEYILAGDVFQVVLSQRFEVPAENVEPFDVYRALRLVNPSPYMFYLGFPEARVVGASPEVVARLENGRVEVRPIAGTRPRGATAEDDARLEAELLVDPKERAEHIMLIDLGRNDVGRIAATGTVRVDDTMSIERYSHVMHMVSSVSGELAPGLDAFDVLRATFPTGTLSGAPKIRAMEIIEELEPHRRGLYGGAVGYFAYGGNMDLAIAIRTLVFTGDRVFLQAGAGIVYDSDPEKEHEETVNKARGALRAVELARNAKVL